VGDASCILAHRLLIERSAVNADVSECKFKITYLSIHVVRHSLRFTLVSEPAAEEDDEDCIEIGYAYVSLNEILQTGRDLVCAEIPSQHH